MSVHRGVSCDKCGKSGFSGKRYKCLLCFDFDLCADCYESLGEDTANNGRHTSSHPVQCILTRAEMSLYYGGDHSADFAYSFTCPYCSHPGYTEQTLQEHVNTQHADQRTEVICPICATLPDGDANFVSDDFPEHLAIEHQAVRDMDDSSQRLIRRIHQRGGRMKGYHRLYTSGNTYQPQSGGAGSLFNTGYLPRKERQHGGFSHQQPSGSEADPLADLLSQLSSSHRESLQLHSAGMPNLDALNEERFEQLSKQYLEYNKYSLNQFSDKPSSSDAKNAHPYKTMAEGQLSKGGKEPGGKSKEIRELHSIPVRHEMTQQMKDISKESEENKEAFDLMRADQWMFLSELLISSLAEEWKAASSSDDELDMK